MTRAVVLGLLLVGVGALPHLPVAARQQSAHPWLAPEVQNLVYLGDDRPVLFRLNLFLDGKPYSSFWDAHLQRLFHFLDRNENGTLDPKELERMPSARQLLSQAENPNLPPSPVGPKLIEVDTDGDGKVSREEFTRYYQNNEVSPVRLLAVPGSGHQATALSAFLFRVLDTNKDGKLSRAELEAAGTVLHRFDLDDDDLITVAELQSADARAAASQQAYDPNLGFPGGTVVPLPFLLVPRERTDERVVQRVKTARAVLDHYDRNRNGRLSRDEIGFPRELFDRLGPHGLGELDSNQLLGWLLGPPDVELTIRMGKVEPGRVSFEAVKTDPKQLRLPVDRVSPLGVRVPIGGVSLQVIRMDNPANQVVIRFTRFFLDQFELVDRQKKGVLTAKQLEGPQFSYLRQIMKLADRDEDDRLTEKELREFGEIMDGATDTLITLSFSDSGQSLFELLDSNHDGQLSLRELKQVWNRLRGHDFDGDGQISKSELPRDCRLNVTQGGLYNFAYYGRQFQVSQPAPRRKPAQVVAEDGPVWFRKMDRNGDGDVSRREFLGSLEDFARIDTDGDGLISLDEAIKAEAWLKERHQPKP